MSRFFTSKFKDLKPYTPGEQPKDGAYVKLNTNESPYPPSPRATEYAAAAAAGENLYCDPECTALRKALANRYGVSPDRVICGNGSDDVLNFAFSAFCDADVPAVFADITYGFYRVFAAYNRVPYRIVPLTEDLRVDPADYYGAGGTVFIANPNAPTGIALSRAEMEKIVAENGKNVVVADEAYVDFGAESCVPLTEKYDNLLTVGTFSKSRSLAGARIGWAIGSAQLIRDLNTVRCSVNPYNVSAAAQAAGVGSLADDAYNAENAEKIKATRAYLSDGLKKLGFSLTDSSANFVFARSDKISGEEVYLGLKKKGVLVRHFSDERIKDYVRITVGTAKQTNALLKALKEIL